MKIAAFRPAKATIAVSLAMVCGLIAGCADEGGPVVDPSTPAQIKAQILEPGTAPGFLLALTADVRRTATAQLFTVPGGGPARACNDLISPYVFRPRGLLSASQEINIRDPRRYPRLASGMVPSWFEWIDVYHGTEAARVVRQLPGLIGQCAHFPLQGSGPRLLVHMASTRLQSLGDEALYIIVRLRPAAGVPGPAESSDWIVIRSDKTLIWIANKLSPPVIDTKDHLTLRLARVAWHRYSSV